MAGRREVVVATNTGMELLRSRGKWRMGISVVFKGGKGGQCLLGFRPCSEWQMLEAVVELSLTSAHFKQLTKWCFAVRTRFVGVNVASSKQDLHHPLVPIVCSTPEWCLAKFIFPVGVDLIPSE